MGDKDSAACATGCLATLPVVLRERDPRERERESWPAKLLLFAIMGLKTYIYCYVVASQEPVRSFLERFLEFYESLILKRSLYGACAWLNEYLYKYTTFVPWYSEFH